LRKVRKLLESGVGVLKVHPQAAPRWLVAAGSRPRENHFQQLPNLRALKRKGLRASNYGPSVGNKAAPTTIKSTDFGVRRPPLTGQLG